MPLILMALVIAVGWFVRDLMKHRAEVAEARRQLAAQRRRGDWNGSGGDID